MDRQKEGWGMGKGWTCRVDRRRKSRRMDGRTDRQTGDGKPERGGWRTRFHLAQVEGRAGAAGPGLASLSPALPRLSQDRKPLGSPGGALGAAAWGGSWATPMAHGGTEARAAPLPAHRPAAPP